jgi:copper(I)-binding protein
MTPLLNLRTFAVATMVAGALAGSAAASPASPVTITEAWLRPAPTGMAMTSGYLTIRNTSARPVRLRAATSPSIGSITLHRSVVTGGIARMEALSDGLVIPPGGSAVFKPGGNHMMLEGLSRPLKVGDKVTVTLSFDGLPATPAVFEVRGSAPDAAMPPGMKMR